MQQEEATMAAYIVATVRISDPEKFAPYGKAIAGLSERFGGVPVVKAPVAEVLEGGSPVGERVVVTRFETAAAARASIGPHHNRAAEIGGAPCRDSGRQFVSSLVTADDLKKKMDQ